MSVSLLIDPISSIFNSTGDTLAGTLEFYEAGTNTPLDTFTASSGDVANDNPLSLTGGRATVFGTDGLSYKIVLKDASGSTIKTIDNIQPVTIDSTSMSYTSSQTGAAASTVSTKLNELVSVFDFGATGDGVADESSAFQLAINSGKAFYVPNGDYRFSAGLTHNTTTTALFGQGLRFFGESMVGVNFIIDFNSDSLFSLSPDTLGEFSMDIEMSGFNVTKEVGRTGMVGITLDTSYMVNMSKIWIDGLSTGIHIPCVIGDNDGSNMITIEQMRIENCDTWGINAKGDSGFNETSFIHLEQVFIQSCGTANLATIPPSGGMTWKGQILTMNQCAFTINQNCALYIQGEAGLAQSVDLQNTTFENNHGRNIYCTGISQFKARGIQQYHNDTNVGTTGIEFDGSTYTVRNVEIDGCVVRATSGNNPFTAFKISGANAELGTCSVDNVVWDNFDYTGQVRYDGWQDKPTSIAHKEDAQNIYTTTSAMIFDTEDHDGQGRYDEINGRWSISYQGLFSIKGKITITSCDADVPVTIRLYNASTASIEQEVIYNADGATTQTFDFDFTAQLGATGLTRTYEIRALQGSAAVKALDVSNNGYNTLSIYRLSEQI